MVSEQEKQIKKIVAEIDKAITKFQKSIPGTQKAMADELDLLIKDFDTKGQTITNNAKNLKLLGDIKRKVEKIVLNPDYVADVKEYIKAFETVATLQVTYAQLFNKNYSPPANIKEINKISIQAVVESLTESGLDANVSAKVRDILRQNITTGGAKYSDMKEQLRSFLVSDKNGLGALEKYTGTITKDAINQFSGQYSKLLTDDLRLEWMMYTGSLKTTSREWCIWMVKKKWVHKSEFPTILNGMVDGHQCAINPKSGLPNGMIDGTNAISLQVLHGGHNCDHGFYPVSSAIVPLALRMKHQ